MAIFLIVPLWYQLRSGDSAFSSLKDLKAVLDHTRIPWIDLATIQDRILESPLAQKVKVEEKEEGFLFTSKYSSPVWGQPLLLYKTEEGDALQFKVKRRFIMLEFNLYKNALNIKALKEVLEMKV
jgi:hypothetical protein